ncbi:MAG TPA: folylpolyglutamate synthase/dihydrofolate synthase family protein [Saprospiraceae bacterium]|nr:folylpolyglutamate synthase/dihydrofolate synthase family protein [Saprospiraceae bacterium]
MAPAFSDYSAALDFLYRQLPMYQRIGGKAFKPGLDNIRKLLSALGHPQHSFPSIHIAGTNGKGSTSHMLAAILQASGLKTGLYTSPHYKDFRERVKVNGQLIPQDQVLRFVNANYEAILEIQPSYFELTVALAFTCFREQQVDVAVVETGLGGRLDSTNVVNPLLSVITNIGYDHQDVLGDTLAQIAGEKAGIIKPDTPLVVGHTHPETQPVFEAYAKRVQAGPVLYADQEFEARMLGIKEFKSVLEITRNGQPYAQALTLDALGTYQIQNLTTALASAEVLKEQVPITDASIAAGLSNMKQLTYFIGRWQVLQEQPLIIADSGHNKEGFAEALAYLKQQSYEQLHFVLGFAQGKDHTALLQLLPKAAHYYWSRPDVPRALPLNELQSLVEKARLSGAFFPSVAAAVRAAKTKAKAADLIFIGGSSFMVADALHLTY